jgi:hypothetical protein
MHRCWSVVDGPDGIMIVQRSVYMEIAAALVQGLKTSWDVVVGVGGYESYVVSQVVHLIIGFLQFL